MQYPTIKSFYFSFGIGFFFKYIIMLPLLLKKNEKDTIFVRIFNQKFLTSK
jgi:hypothetical protein